MSPLEPTQALRGLDLAVLPRVRACPWRGSPIFFPIRWFQVRVLVGAPAFVGAMRLVVGGDARNFAMDGLRKAVRPIASDKRRIAVPATELAALFCTPMTAASYGPL